MNEKAAAAFMAKTEEARDYLAMIKAELDDHMSVNPEQVTWGNVGDAEHVAELLRDIARFMGHAE